MFGSADALGGAYGIAVSLLMTITTLLAALVALQWGYHPILVAAVNGAFLVIDLVFVSANATKLMQGGWFPLVLTGVVAFLMLTWRTGYMLLTAALASAAARGRVRQLGSRKPSRPAARGGGDLYCRAPFDHQPGTA